MPRHLPADVERRLILLLGPVSDEIIIGPEAAQCIRDRAAAWGQGRPQTVDELADVVGECLCPPFSVTQAILAYIEAVEGYKWVPPALRQRERNS
jgi:hypothetical protein